MLVRLLHSSAIAAAVALSVCAPARAQDQSPTMALVVPAGRPLRVALTERVKVKRVGQPVTGTLVDALYAYDRVVVPAGTLVRGHVDALDAPSKLVRLQLLLAGDFSPNRRIALEFDTLVLGDGREVPIRTTVKGAADHLALRVATPDKGERSDGDDNTGITGRAREQVAQAREEATRKARDALSAIRNPGKKERLTAALVNRLPYHPQYLAKGTVFDADLLAPLDFGAAAAPAAAPPGNGAGA